MAIFYYPNRTSPTTTVNLLGKDYAPDSRPTHKHQSRDMTPGGAAIVYDLAVTKQYVVLDIRALTLAEATNLDNFIQSTLNWASKTFDLTLDGGGSYNTCRFWFDDLDFPQTVNHLYSTSLFILTGA